jgi:hypothetical protein
MNIVGCDLFHIPFFIPFRTAQSMRIKKENLTPYPDVLKESYLKWVNDSDLNFS